MMRKFDFRKVGNVFTLIHSSFFKTLFKSALIMVCCNCLPNRARQPSINIDVGRGRSGTDFRRHPSETLVGIGCCFAGARQFIFLSNALLIGFGMAVAAAAVHEADTEIGKWLGSSWFYLISGVSLLGMMSCAFGMTGACYQKWFLLILVC